MSPQPLNDEFRQIAIGACRICLISKTNCRFCKFQFALKIIEAEKIERFLETVTIYTANDGTYGVARFSDERILSYGYKNPEDINIENICALWS